MSLGYFEQLEQNINHLLADKKYKQAYQLCSEILIKFPEEKRFLKLKEHTEEAAKIENEKIVENKLKEFETLWQQEKFVEILKELKDLFLIAPENKKLKKFYHAAQEAYREKVEKLKKEFKQKEISRLDTLFSNNPEELLEELFALERANPGNLEIKSLTTNYRDRLIAKKIAEKQQLLNSDKYPDIDHFIQQLEKIDDKSPRIRDLMASVDNRKRKSQLEQTGEFVYQGLAHLDTLMKLKKFDKVIQAANEILSVDEKNKKIKRILSKAKNKLFQQTKELTVDSILCNKDSLKTAYLQNKDNFIKL